MLTASQDVLLAGLLGSYRPCAEIAEWVGCSEEDVRVARKERELALGRERMARCRQRKRECAGERPCSASLIDDGSLLQALKGWGGRLANVSAYALNHLDDGGRRL